MKWHATFRCRHCSTRELLAQTFAVIVQLCSGELLAAAVMAMVIIAGGRSRHGRCEEQLMANRSLSPNLFAGPGWSRTG